MTDRDPRSAAHPDDDALLHDDEGLHPTGEGLSETPIHATYEVIAVRNDLVRQLEDVVATARSWARADGSPGARRIAEALAELYERLGEAAEADDG